MVKTYGGNAADISSKTDKKLSITFSILLSISVVKQHEQKRCGRKGVATGYSF